MVGRTAAAMVADDDEKFDTRAFIGLAAWGVCAAISVAIAVFAARTDLGIKRLSAALIAIASPPEESQSVAAANLLARTANAEREARRAAETVIAISTDRERTAARLSAIERDISEVSGSVSRAIALAAEGKAVPPVLTMSSASLINHHKNAAPAGWAAPTPPSVASGEPAAPMPSQPANATTPPPSERISVQAAAPPQNVPLPKPNPPHPQTPPQSVAAAPPPQATPAKPEDNAAPITGSIATGATPESAPPKVEFGVDLGPSLTVSRLRSRWTKLVNERPDLFKGLRPVITIRDTGAGKPAEIRLVAGPLATVNAATDLCSALGQPTGAPYICRPSVFDGQRLNVQ